MDITLVQAVSLPGAKVRFFGPHFLLVSHHFSLPFLRSLQFFAGQRAGVIQDLPHVPAFRANSDLGRKGLSNEDLSGGWYDSGALTKFGFPAAWSTTILAWGYLEHKDEWLGSGLSERLKIELKWGLDHILQCHTFDSTTGPEPRTTRLYVQVGSAGNDNSQWTRPEQMVWDRPLSYVDWTNPGTDVAAEMAAALAAGFLVFVEDDPNYATELVVNARTLYQFAHTNPVKKQYQESVPDAGSFYPSSGYNDELAWAALWLHKAQGGVYNYLNDAKLYYDKLNKDGVYPMYRSFHWDDKTAGVSLLLARETNDAAHRGAVEKYLMEWMRPWVRNGQSNGDVGYTESGLAYRFKNVGWYYPFQLSLGSSFLALVYRGDIAKNQGTQVPMYNDLENFARSQLNYILGNNLLKQSYQIKFSGAGPRMAHHRIASCDPNPSVYCDWQNYNTPDPNPTRLVGAVVQGPYDDDRWNDRRNDWERNGITLVNNAVFTVTALKMGTISQTCTNFNEDPWSFGGGYRECCRGLTAILSDWDGNSNHYYLCRVCTTESSSQNSCQLPAFVENTGILVALGLG